MMKKFGGLVLVSAIMLATGCMSERDAVNRVQTNVLKKSFFVGENFKTLDDDPEFYMRGTVIDVGYGAAQDGLFTSTYAQPVSRIRWEITENHLNARLAYERIEDSDGKGNKIDGVKKKTTNDGQIVASFRIESHFDIKRAYNSTTGEALNVIEENASDRPWYEREYIRVDWSKNEFTDAYDFDTLSMMGLYGGIKYEPVAFFVDDPNDENAPKFDMEGGYFDVTTKAFATPGMIDLSRLGWGIDKFPACMLPNDILGGSEPYGNCNPVEITIRQSFKKVVDKDYEPVEMDGMRFQAYGAFTSDRRGYDQHYGMVDDKWHRFTARYNIWERSHYYQDPTNMTGPVECNMATTTADKTPGADPNRDENKDGTADECAAVTTAVGVGGSQCDKFKNKCTLPYTKRQAVTIPWYINGNTDEDLFEATNWAVQEWNIAMVAAAQTAKLVECRRVKGANCDADYPMWKGQMDDYEDAANIYREVEFCHRQKGWSSPECDSLADTLVSALSTERGDATDATTMTAIGALVKAPPIIVLCHNPVVQGEHPACGKVGLAPRLGDLRYNNVVNIPKPQDPSAWGIMVDGDDPVTGEKVAASINIWTHITDVASQGAVDLIRYINGELKTEDITNGNYIHNWVAANKAAERGGSLINTDEIHNRLAAGAGLDPEEYKKLINTPASEKLQQVMASAHRKMEDVVASTEFASPKMMSVMNRLKRGQGTAIEDDLMNPAMLQLAGVSKGLAANGPLQSLASPLSLNNPKIQQQLYQMRENALARKGVCILREAPEASSLTGLADVMKKKFPIAAQETDVDKQKRVSAMFRHVRRRYQYGVIAHEMGHSVGHRHNFVGSSGSLFYRPQYWQLRTKNGAVKAQCKDAQADGKDCVGPRYFDPVTDEEQGQLINMFASGSVMDYPGDITQDFFGVNIWDYAATRFFYGDNVAVYTDSDMVAGSAIGFGITNATDTFGGLTGITYKYVSGKNLRDFHYSQLNGAWKVLGKCYNVNPKQPAWWNEEKDGKWDQVVDGHIVSINGQATKCRQRPVDYVAWNDLRMPTGAEIAPDGDGFYRGGPSVDAQKRLRVPYHFATDHWADTGNASVFRHDSGADTYEQAQFLITSQENRHIFDNFRRNRSTFSVRGAADRSFGRYNEKLVGLGGGMAFYKTIYQQFLLANGLDFNLGWAYMVETYMKENMLASTIAFDHLTRQLSRPEHGEHYPLEAAYGDTTLRSANDPEGNAGTTSVIIPNGATGYFRDIGFGGHPLENAYSDKNGDYDTQYVWNCGSYYDKINSIIHMSMSEDRFVSQSRGDFYDARFRANGMADTFPDGYRRLIANSLTGDRSILAPRLAADASGNILLNTKADPLDANATKYPASPMGWVSWWPSTGPTVCFASNGRNVCSSEFNPGMNFKPDLPANTVRVDPQVGWEQQKFIMLYALIYVTANQQSNWIDMMRIYRYGQEQDPGFSPRIEWQDPTSGQIYAARTYGKECLFGSGTACTGGQWVQKGIAARILEWANHLTAKAYKLNTGACPATANYPAGYNANGRPCYVLQADGSPVVVADPTLTDLNGGAIATCDQNATPGCKPLDINDNHWAFELAKYKSVPDYLWNLLQAFGYQMPHELGIY